ncbi:hypothetical protein EXE10_00200 [Acinetobacter sp. WCHAc060033]|uniref:hypothetical protein n=1 Tax=Acinetobacter TaxID=469 RepID=UPI00102306F9|nr:MULTISPECIES: hypothetical protein [Acinetobacter]RZG73558.1 hypothetical protein EXU29_07615 [Acinetobacter wuhouensis]RZG92481.1 hypothetical protein EXE10_00200 [Acinetobacter sp. WCHAc060033]
MKMMKSACFMIAVITAPSLYAQTDSANQNQAYGDNPNIFRVLAHKTSEAVQNTAEKVGTATEKGIQKIKPSFDATIENTKNYTTEQATIARDNTRQGIDTAVKKVEQTKDRITGKNSYNIPIESGSLSQSSTTVNPSQNNTVSYTAPIVQEAPISTQPIQQIPLPQNNVQNAQEEPEIKKQSLPIENNATPNPSNERDTTTNNSSTSSAKDSTDDDSGVPR